MSKRIFTGYFENNVSEKGFKVSRQNKGKLLDDMSISDDAISEDAIEPKNTSYKYIYFFLVFCFSIILFKIMDLQIARGDYYYNLSKGNRIRYQIVRAPRGIIYDKNGSAMVKNIANFIIVIEPFDLPKDATERSALFQSLAQDLAIPQEELEKSIPISTENQFLDPKIIAENIDQETAIRIKMKYQDYPAVTIESSPAREYLNTNLSHLTGYIGRITKEEYEKDVSKYDLNDYIGKNGLELSYEEYLRGVSGKQMVEVDAQGRVVRPIGTQDQLNPKMGNNIVTSIDSGLEAEMANALNDSMKASGAKGGSAIAMNPKTGQVLGMVSLPSFDNNLFSKGIKQEDYTKLINDPNKPLFSRSVNGTYPAGSVIKPVIAAAALQEKVCNINTTVQSTGSLIIKNKYDPSIQYVFPDWKAGGHGSVNVTKAIAESVNTFFYYVGGGYENFQGLGAARLEKYLKAFGLGSPVGIDIPNEAAGLVPTPEWKQKEKGEGWYTADNYQISIGQGNLLVTPLQVVSYTAAIANGGTLYKPQIVSKIVDQNNNVVKEFTPQTLNSGMVSYENIDIVRRGMRMTVTDGTAKSFRDLPFAVGAKTGTAQFGPNNSKEHAWFVAFAPYEMPEIAVSVIVEGAGEGSVYAAPVAKRILEYYFSHK
ncbi:penicillin-binding protein 2 [bacterium]|nr:penicillin-binding protein 2 [bacterium]